MLDKALLNKIKESLGNSFGDENFDHYRFRNKLNEKLKFSLKLRRLVWRMLSDFSPSIAASLYVHKIKSFLPGLQNLYQVLDSESQNLLVNILAYRLVGYKKVMINGQAKDFLKLMSESELDVISDEKIDIGFGNIILENLSLKKLGYDLILFATKFTVIIDFKIEQYALNLTKNTKSISAKTGETVLDVGACWGDTSLYFSHKVGVTGQVYAFEFIPSNLEILKKNLSLNPSFSKNIKIQNSPVGENSEDKLFYLDQGPASRLFSNPISGQTGEAKLISLDDFVKNNEIEKVDFIKMDIEGSELRALKGAKNTIMKFKPRLAIAIYHSLNDFVEIPEYLKSLGLGYEFHLGHFTIHSEETILFAE